VIIDTARNICTKRRYAQEECMKHMISFCLLFVVAAIGCDTATGPGTSDLSVSTIKWELGEA
jgi:hypothetical protein